MFIARFAVFFRISKFSSQVYTRLLKAYFTAHTTYKEGTSKEADMAFEGLKKAFTSAPVLGNVDSQKPFIIEADASNFAREQGDDENLHPVAFHSRKFDTIEINYAICDK